MLTHMCEISTSIYLEARKQWRTIGYLFRHYNRCWLQYLQSNSNYILGDINIYIPCSWMSVLFHNRCAFHYILFHDHELRKLIGESCMRGATECLVFLKSSQRRMVGSGYAFHGTNGKPRRQLSLSADGQQNITNKTNKIARSNRKADKQWQW